MVGYDFYISYYYKYGYYIIKDITIMLDDILEEFMPTETITIVVKRMWKNKKHDVVKQVFEIPVLVIHYLVK